MPSLSETCEFDASGATKYHAEASYKKRVLELIRSYQWEQSRRINVAVFAHEVDRATSAQLALEELEHEIVKWEPKDVR